MTAAQATNLSVEAVGSATPAVQATKLGVESLTSPSAYTVQGVKLFTEVLITPENATVQSTKLFTEVLATVLLTGPAQAITLTTESLGNTTPAVQAESLLTETLASTTPAIQAEALWVEVLASVRDAPIIPVRFHEKVALLYGAKQDNLGILQTLTGSHAIAGLNLSFEDVINTTTHEFGENCLGRSAAVSLENLTRTITFETLFPTVDTASPLSELSLALTDWFKACGAAVTLDEEEGMLQFSNETVDDSRLTVEVQQIPENAKDNGQNSYKILDSFGIVGLDLTAGKLGKLNFSFSGNPQLPSYRERLTPNFGQQKLNVLGPIKQPNVLTAVLTDLDSNTQSNFCFYKLQTNSLFGFGLTQSQLSDAELFDRVPKPTPLALTVMLANENSVLAVTPEYCISRRYSMQLQFGLSDFPITLEFTELQMSDYKRITADGVVGLVIGFLNTGFTKLSFTGPTA